MTISVLTPTCAAHGNLTNQMDKCSLTMTDYVNKEHKLIQSCLLPSKMYGSEQKITPCKVVGFFFFPPFTIIKCDPYDDWWMAVHNQAHNLRQAIKTGCFLTLLLTVKFADFAFWIIYHHLSLYYGKQNPKWMSNWMLRPTWCYSSSLCVMKFSNGEG